MTMNLELFATIIAAILVARILSPLADVVKHAIFGSARAAAKSSAVTASMGSSKSSS